MDNLQKIMEVGVGTGAIKNGKDIHRSLLRQAHKDKVAPARLDPSTLATMGIGFEKCQKN